jgi:hypothetical protein
VILGSGCFARIIWIRAAYESAELFGLSLSSRLAINDIEMNRGTKGYGLVFPAHRKGQFSKYTED